MDDIDDMLVALALEAGENLGYEIDDLELLGSAGRQILRVTIDSPGGVTLDDCTSFSRDFSALLDVDDPIKGRFTLEVSSPGLDRRLKKLAHYEKNLGKTVKVVPSEKVGDRNFLLGKLLGADEHKIRLLVEDEVIVIALDNVKKARLEPEI